MNDYVVKVLAKRFLGYTIEELLKRLKGQFAEGAEVTIYDRNKKKSYSYMVVNKKLIKK